MKLNYKHYKCRTWQQLAFTVKATIMDVAELAYKLLLLLISLLFYLLIIENYMTHFHHATSP